MHLRNMCLRDNRRYKLKSDKYEERQEFNTHAVSPHFQVSELQHCFSVPLQVALLCFGPHKPSEAKGWSMTV